MSSRGPPVAASGSTRRPVSRVAGARRAGTRTARLGDPRRARVAGRCGGNLTSRTLDRVSEGYPRPEHDTATRAENARPPEREGASNLRSAIGPDRVVILARPGSRDRVPSRARRARVRLFFPRLVFFRKGAFSARRTIIESLSRRFHAMSRAALGSAHTNFYGERPAARSGQSRVAGAQIEHFARLSAPVGAFRFRFRGPYARTPMMRKSLSVPSEVCDDRTLNLVNLRCSRASAKRESF